MQNSPIGIFDSGIGGLTVFREIAKILPQEDLIYLGDTARVPYGTKSSETVTTCSLQNVEFLAGKKVKMVVVACNTASAFALPALQQKNKIPILGVIEPGAQGALKVSRTKRIGVIGTEGTIRSEAYAERIKTQDESAFVVSTACPLFVPLVEEGWLEGEIVEKIAGHYLKDLLLANIDSLILGCTHYPLLKRALKKSVGSKIALIDSAEETALSVQALLQKTKLIRNENKKPLREFYVTDSPERFRRVGEIFLKTPLTDVQRVEL